MSDTHLSRGQLLKLVVVRFGTGFVGLSILFFLPAGTFRYWQAWLWVATLITPMVLVLIYLLRNDPELLERRMRFREKEKHQRLVIQLSWVWLLLAFTLPGFDRRFGWSHVPTAVVLVADALMFLAYCLFIWVMRENTYASRVVEVVQEQKVISSGPYSIVRHPMYLATLLLYAFTPLALGSYWAIIPALLIVPILVARITNEETVLLRDLKGYSEYMQRVRYRLIPRVWQEGLASIQNVLTRIFVHDIEGVEPRIVNLERPIYVIGMSVDTNLKRIYRDVPALGKRYADYKKAHPIPHKKEPWAFAAVSSGFDKDRGALSYFMGDVVTSLAEVPDGWSSLEIPAIQYAVFPVRPKNRFGWGLAIANTKRYAYTVWLPKSGYEPAGVIDDFEYHDDRGTRKRNPEIDLYVAIRAKG